MKIVEPVHPANRMSGSMATEFVGEELRRHRLEFDFLLDRAIAAVAFPKGPIRLKLDGLFPLGPDV
jgi:hypothetical protein